MAENDQTQEKTQEPTQRRLEKAREDGDILSSKEMFVFASSAVGLLVITVLGFVQAIWFLTYCLPKGIGGGHYAVQYSQYCACSCLGYRAAVNAKEVPTFIC